MKKLTAACMGILLAGAMFALSACDGFASGGTPGGAQTPPQKEQVSPLAVLDTVDIPAAFGVRAGEDWSFAFRLTSDYAVEHFGSVHTGMEDTELLSITLGADFQVDYLLGLRASEERATGFDLFGGGSVGLGLRYIGLTSSAEPIEKRIEAGVYNDADWIYYSRLDDGQEGKFALLELEQRAYDLVQSKALERLATAAKTIPNTLSQGLSLRVGVEKLIELGFRAEIDTSAGLKIRLVGTTALFTDLLNDTVEELLPAEYLLYLPRLDFRYRATEFDVTLAFNENGLFEEYSVYSDVDLSSELRIRGVVSFGSGVRVGGGFSAKAYYDEVPMPDFPSEDE